MFSTCGRGPTTDMSPSITLISCGSSSMDNRRSREPTRVTLGSSRTAPCEPSSAGFTRMVRKLVYHERLAVEPDPLLPEQDRTGAFQANGDRGHEQDGKGDQQPRAGNDIILDQLD